MLGRSHQCECPSVHQLLDEDGAIPRGRVTSHRQAHPFRKELLMHTSHDASPVRALSLECRHVAARALCSDAWNDSLLIQQVGTLVRYLRHAAGWSQEEFAARCGLHRTYIGAIERGEKAITIPTANKLAHALGMTLAQLFAQLETVPDMRDDDRRERGPHVRQCCRPTHTGTQAQWRFLAVLGRPNHFESGYRSLSFS